MKFQATHVIMTQANKARRLLIENLGKPDRSNESAYEAWVIQVRDLRAMGYNELMKEIVRVSNDNR